MQKVNGNCVSDVNPALSRLALLLVALHKCASVSFLRNGAYSNSSLQFRSLRSNFSGFGEGAKILSANSLQDFWGIPHFHHSLLLEISVI